MKKVSTDIKLRERVKELKCLYDLSKIVLKANNDLKSILSETLEIVPRAMLYPKLAEVSITVRKEVYATSGFSRKLRTVALPLAIGKVRYGTIEFGYRKSQLIPDNKHPFLPEELNLFQIVSRHLSTYIRRASIEEDKKNLQLQLQHAERLAFVGELSAGIAHELNEPLGNILGYAHSWNCSS